MAAQPARTIWTLLIAVVLGYSLAVIASDPLRIHADCTVHIEAAEKILAGGLGGVDAVDTNPPLIMFITAVPTAVAHAIGAHPIPVFLLFTWVFTVIVTFASRSLFAGALSARESNHADALALSLAVASCAVQFDGYYGQREYLFALGVVPYLLVRFRRWEGVDVASSSAIAWGFVAGIATSIKPQLALIVLAPEAYWLASHRSLRQFRHREIAAAIAAAALYLAYLVLIPEVREYFFGRWVPLLASGYGAYNSPFQVLVFLRYESWRPAALAFLPFLFRARDGDVAARLIRPLAAAVLAATAVYFIQHKGFAYQAIPLQLFTYLIVGLSIAQLLTRANGDDTTRAVASIVASRTWIVGLTTVLIITIVGSMVILPSSVRRAEAEIGRDAVGQALAEESNRGDSVLFLETNLVDFYPLIVQMQRHQASRSLYAFPLPLLYYGSEAAPGQPFPYRGAGGVPLPAEEQRYREELLADIHSARPKSIFIDAMKQCVACPPGFSLLEYFERTGFLASIPAYEKSRQVDRFVIYKRRD